MKPIYLSMQAFGPFADVQTINFSDLGTNPLFLINGPTGAGKSTILDAISFALYGESTGKEREPSSMRCDLSDADIPTKVIFDFNLSGNIYRVVRTPAQELAKKKGSGTTVKGPTVIVYRHSGPDITGFIFDQDHPDVELLPLKGVKEVNEWVKELTGLSSEQFRQVMVLPQGQFRKLLLADSDQRELIFSQLFQTHIYKKIEEQLKNQSAQLRSDRSKLKENISGSLGSVSLGSVDELKQKLLLIEPDYNDAKRKLKLAQKNALNADKAFDLGKKKTQQFLRLSELREAIASLQKNSEKISSLKTNIANAQKAQKISSLHKEVVRVKSELESESKSYDEVSDSLTELDKTKAFEEKQYTELEPQWLALDEKKKALNDWGQKKEALDSLIEERQKQDGISTKLKKFDVRLQTTQNEKENVEKSIKDLDYQIKDATEKLVQLPQLKVDLKQYEHLGKLRSTVLEAQKNKQALQLEASELRSELDRYTHQFNQDELELKRTELSWHQGQAYELSLQLKPNEPCMVCGSTEHPQKASATKTNYADKSKVEQARVALQNTQKALADTQVSYNSKSNDISNCDNRVQELNNELGENHTMPIEWFREQYRQCNGQLGMLNALENEQKAWQETLNEHEEKLGNLELSLGKLAEQRDAIKVELSICSARIGEREQEVPEDYRDSKKVNSEIEGLKKHILAVSDSYETLIEKKQKTERDITAKKSQLSDLKQRIENYQQALALAKDKWRDALVDSGFENEQSYKQACCSEDELARMQEQVNDHDTQLKELVAQEAYIKGELEGSEQPDLTALEDQVKVTEALKDEAVTIEANFSHQYKSLMNVSQQLDAINLQASKLDEAYSVVGTLADVASGQTGSRVSLQRYVLGVLLDDVLNEASQRLQLMSKGRYRLIRKLDRSKGNKTSGLELEVEDAYSGNQRPANTLSGGESFMAALSLALGLSDVVQSYSGGVKLETLFIDEGFGSLDMESLELAIQTLVDLRKSGRTIGIISHVSELKEQITQRIDVTTSDQGSTVRVVHT